MVTKLFTRVDVRDVYLDGGNGYSLDGIVDGNGGMGVGAGVEDDAVAGRGG